MPLIYVKTDIQVKVEREFSIEYNRRTVGRLIESEFHVVPAFFPYVVRLEEIPDDRIPVQIVGYTASSGMPTQAATFYVDYSIGYVYFHSNDAGKSVNPHYTGLGSLVDAVDINLIVSRLQETLALFRMFKVEAQDTLNLSVRVRTGTACVSGLYKVTYYGNNNVNFGPQGGYTLIALPVGYYNKIALALQCVELAVPLYLTTLVCLEGTPAATASAVDEPIVPTGFIPLAMITVHDDGTGEAGTIEDISRGDIEDIRPWLTTAAFAHGTLFGLAANDHPQYLLRSGGVVTGNVGCDAGVTIDGRDISEDGTKLDLMPDTAEDRFDEIKGLDGHGSGLDADKLDGYDAQYILSRSGVNPAQYFTIYIHEPNDEQVVFNGWSPDGPIYLYRIGIWATTAPTGADLTFDILKNNQELGYAFGLSAGSQAGLFQLSPAIATVDGEFLGVKCKSVGSTIAGSKVTIILYFTMGIEGSKDLKCDVAVEAGVSP